MLRKVVILLQHHVKVVLVHQSRILDTVEVIQHERGLFSVKLVSMERGGVEFGLDFSTFIYICRRLDTTQSTAHFFEIIAVTVESSGPIPNVISPV